MNSCGSGKTELELRSLLGCFLFSGDAVEKKIKVLSGGEKARVALAKTIVSKANFLLLDEPTNHLDIHSVDLLIEALNKYEGSYILVSHDRYFVNKTANKIWEIEDYKVKEFVGSYDEWEEMKKRKAQINLTPAGKKQVNNLTPDVSLKAKEKKLKFTHVPELKSIDKDLKKEHQETQRHFQQMEEKIASLRQQKKALEAALASHEIYTDKNKVLQTETEYKTVSFQLKEANAQYENIFEKLIELENKIEQ